ncbi:hypothetical protein NS228_06275 [Methylobacterium indicum]|uniref:hypothetical protein n=1 Tax=Methylobacterium indicum TaxID=1775910 RepID=UPI000733EA8D|nr:hypothetical protein [Methylobacterium indicum]KTS30849.1 hypothetical protein NS229_14555 [Methylobacterium indicum]KTS41563.1 hypothetical protein NS228_06275 [Methylobacterium indicum]KTS45178.1 hypothetical protein NS230_24265 [Methylobacterium indicum]
MPNIIIELSRPLTGHTVIRQLEFREPRWSDVMAVGECYVWTPRGDGWNVITPLHDNIRQYAERLIAEGDKPGDPINLTLLGLEDTFKVRDAIMSFFRRVDPNVKAGSTT